MRDSWKEFSKNELTHSGAHYLMAIQETYEEQGYARLSDVAKRLKISKGSLSTSLKTLIKKRLILEDDNKHLSLSDKGEELAANTKNTYSVLLHLFGSVLNVDDETAEVDACKIEHLLSMESSSQLLKMVKALENNPKLQQAIQKEMEKYSACNLKGCRVCSKKKFCLSKNLA